METPSIAPLHEDMEANRKLCQHFMRRLAEALRLLYQQGEGADAALLPAWVPLLFGSKEGLLAAYIKLSQQQIKIADAQSELWQALRKVTQEAGEEDAAQEGKTLTAEDLRLVRSLLHQLGEAEGNP